VAGKVEERLRHDAEQQAGTANVVDQRVAEILDAVRTRVQV